MGITRAEVLGYLPEGLDLSLRVVSSVWDAVGVKGFRLGCMVLMISNFMWLYNYVCSSTRTASAIAKCVAELWDISMEHQMHFIHHW